MRIAIIGMGTAGVTLLKELVKSESFSKMNIDVYDNPINMGQGVPFQNDSAELLINLPAAQMSLNLDNHREFYEWYEMQSTFKFSNPEYLPRFIFGHYMKDYLQKFNHDYDNIHTIKEEVNEVFIESEIGQTDVTYCVCTSNEIENCKQYDIVFLTIGTLSYHDPYGLKGIRGYIKTPYPTYNTLDDVQDFDDIAIIGTGLASLDVIRYVTAHHPKLPITVASRKGRLPSVRGEMPDIDFEYVTPENFNEIKRKHFGNVPLDEAIKLFLKDCALHHIDVETLVHRSQDDPIKDLTYDLEHADELGKLQSILELAKENLNWIWNSLSREDQKRFLTNYQPILKENSNPMPPQTARLLIDHINHGTIKIKRDLEDVQYDDNKFNFKYKDASVERFDIVINATGSKTQLADLDGDDQLVLNLENRQVVQAHPLGGIQIVAETNQIISPRYGTLKHMYALGQLTNGINQSRNGVMMIVKQAVNVVDHLLSTK
ncbi:FAD/NAD(P)-binding protein [Staphylococcus pseudoxylosus]|uniref:Pyridine nucleotide-disulfide oxidoreductase n=1 Tax=Staphylococcus pseudoxylosus TaxID=2282419 RepID=A0AAQ0MIC1_9STAP|nr:FAD/NAD(P)-binding protein [Staphylococcus pseudoxylosus]MCE5001773.1 FAD/NAD(P)-binding protein [Staphylococcus pseudoxylosus]MDW8547076.1 FAD/NAD(P)-binding protein [Staphylococcus pseudoxylosus]MEB6333966.1 FAD/NAD(P)-binding protein [Staphylococcus pseudoxylosus]RMI86453.1 pyridine nucleotide-disulfide oxidoreductase [Staphylococcus pseudoxylosus]